MITDEFYTKEDLKEYILKKISGNIWRSEGIEKTEVADVAINGTLLMYSRRMPDVKYERFPAGTGRYQLKSPKILGICRVDFIDGNSGFFQSAYQLNQNLTGVASVQMAGGNVGDLADFLQWRKMFQRVVSYTPDYLWDRDTNTLIIHNPAQYMGCAVVFCPRTFETVRPNDKDWFMRMSVAQAKLQLGEYRSKFQSIPGPGGKDINLNGQDLLSRASTEIEKLEQELRGFQFRTPITFD